MTIDCSVRSMEGIGSLSLVMDNQVYPALCRGMILLDTGHVNGVLTPQFSSKQALNFCAPVHGCREIPCRIDYGGGGFFPEAISKENT